MRSGQRMSHGQSEVFLSRDVPHLPGQGSADQSPAGEKSGDKAGLSFPLNSGCGDSSGLPDFSRMTMTLSGGGGGSPLESEPLARSAES